MGKNKGEMETILRHTLPLLPKEKPNHLLGMGDLESIDMGVKLGVDTFDSSYPTRAARHGVALTFDGPIKLTQAKQVNRFSPIEKGCTCPTCSKFSLAYLHHLFKAKELTALTLASIHNLHFMVEYMKRVREQIADDIL